MRILRRRAAGSPVRSKRGSRRRTPRERLRGGFRRQPRAQSVRRGPAAPLALRVPALRPAWGPALGLIGVAAALILVLRWTGEPRGERTGRAPGEAGRYGHGERPGSSRADARSGWEHDAPLERHLRGRTPTT